MGGLGRFLQPALQLAEVQKPRCVPSVAHQVWTRGITIQHRRLTFVTTTGHTHTPGYTHVMHTISSRTAKHAANEGHAAD